MKKFLGIVYIKKTLFDDVNVKNNLVLSSIALHSL